MNPSFETDSVCSAPWRFSPLLANLLPCFSLRHVSEKLTLRHVMPAEFNRAPSSLPGE